MVVVLMGVSGTGKTKVGTRLARALGGEFAEGDDYHPPANVAKMRSGVPLDDADRQPWLETMSREIGAWLDCRQDRGAGLLGAEAALSRHPEGRPARRPLRPSHGRSRR